MEKTSYENELAFVGIKFCQVSPYCDHKCVPKNFTALF